MDETALVTQDIYEGAALIQELDARSLPFTAAFWARNPNRDEWRLVIAVPTRRLPSPRATYSQIQQAIIDLELGVALSRVSIVPNSDPLIGTIQQIISSGSSDLVEIPLAGADIAGGPADRGYGYRLDALHYERLVLAALQRVQPDDSVLRSASRLAFLDNFNFDFLLDDGLKAILVEAKSQSKPLTNSDIEKSLSSVQRATNLYRNAAWMVVSRTGFSASALHRLPPSAARLVDTDMLALVHWAGEQDDRLLRDAVMRLRADRATK